MNYLKLFTVGLCTVGLCACSEEQIIKDSAVMKITVCSEAFQIDRSFTRASYSVDPSEGFILNWTAGDTIGIYPVGGDQVAFPISSTNGSSAQFDGGSWAVRSNFAYAAYYPFSNRYYFKNMTELPVSYQGQCQTGNNSTDGLGRYDYQVSEATVPESDGNISITLHHIGCFVRIQLAMPVADTFKSLTLYSDNVKFTAAGTIDLSAESPAISATNLSSSLKLSLENISTASANQILTFYLMLGPADMSSSKITAIVEGVKNKAYSATLSGQNMKVGKAYSYTGGCTIGTTVNAEDVGWDDVTHEYVDLGLSVLWATCNVGASSPEQYGDYFAWGETQPYYFCLNPPVWKDGKEKGYKWASYFDNPSGDGETFVKYYEMGGKVVLNAEDDAAHANWGSEWRMPSYDELEELANDEKCWWQWFPSGNEEFNGIAGHKIQSRIEGYKDNFIFLPYTGTVSNVLGYPDNPYPDNPEMWSFSRYWSNCLWLDKEHMGDGVGVLQISKNTGWHGMTEAKRYEGFPVRPVRAVPLSTLELDKTDFELSVGKVDRISETHSPANASAKKTIWSSSDESVAVVRNYFGDNSCEVYGVSAGTCTITATRGNLTAECTVTVMAPEPEFVDLGLSVKWATFNVESPSPVDWGYPYAWGETESYLLYEYFHVFRDSKPDGFAWTSYFDNPSANGSTFIKYGNNGGLTELEPADDVAHVKWGGNWRMPTKAEYQELIDGCIWTEQSGYYEVKSKISDNYINIPTVTPHKGIAMGNPPYANYWTSTLDESDSSKAYGIRIDGSCVEIVSEPRCYGLRVRPVCE